MEFVIHIPNRGIHYSKIQIKNLLFPPVISCKNNERKKSS